MPVLELPQIRATSPSLAETMRSCLLRAGLSKASGSANVVLGNPKAWLGTAYHAVLEKIAELDVGQDSIEDVTDRLWNEAIEAQERRAAAHVLDHRFGSAAAWPGYHVARASVLIRVRELVGDRPHTGPRPVMRNVGGVEPAPEIREQEFTSFGGRLLGRPDVIRADEVVDYKSGAILEHDAVAQTDIVKAAYVRQLRIYGYLVNQKMGWWPKRGVLLPLAGAAVEVVLDPLECEREANEAIGLLDSYEQHRSRAATPEELASPTPNGCRWCPFKLVCRSFWLAATPDWSRHLDGAAIEGIVLDSPAVIHAGAARAVSIEIHAGSEALRRAVIAPLNPTAHPAVTVLSAGDLVRLVGLRVRADGVLVPTQRTVLARVGDLPTVTTWRIT